MNLSTGLKARIEAPWQAFAGDRPLVAVMRGSYVGSLHRGSVAVTDASGTLLFSAGDPSESVFVRSAAKPFQVMPALLAGALERFAISPRELAILCASHHAEQEHIDTVLSVLKKIGLDETALQCGIHPPIAESTHHARILAGIAPSPACNNCSGAHTGMLMACRAMDWPTDGYGLPEHPLQLEIRRIIGAFCDISPEEVRFATDNCAVPTFYLPLQSAATAFARLTTGEGISPDLAWAARQVREAMMAHPDMIGGQDSFDTDLMRAASGGIVAKGGAEGFQGCGLVERGWGVAMKVSDGNARAIPPAIMQVLSTFHTLSLEQAQQLQHYVQPVQRNARGENVGYLSAIFTLDAAR